MRKLLYVKMMHALSEEMVERGRDTDEISRIKAFNSALCPYNEELARDVLEVAKDSPINKVYCESVTNSNQFDEKPDKKSMFWPAYVLIEETGAKLMETEHVLLYRFADMVAEAFVENGEKYQKGLISLGKERAARGFLEFLEFWPFDKDVDRENLIKDCRGEEHSNFWRIIDKYDAWNINRTLGEDEQGVLFTGGRHKVDELLKELGSDIDVRVLDYSLSSCENGNNPSNVVINMLRRFVSGKQ